MLCWLFIVLFILYYLESKWWCSLEVSILSSVWKLKFSMKTHIKDGVKDTHGIYELVIVQDAWFALSCLEACGGHY